MYVPRAPAGEKKKNPSVSAHLVNKAHSVSEKLTCKKMDLWILPEKKIIFLPYHSPL